MNPHVHVNENRIVSAAASVEADEWRASISPVRANRSPSPTPDFTELDDQDWALRKLNKANSNQPNTAPYDQVCLTSVSTDDDCIVRDSGGCIRALTFLIAK